MKKSAVIALFAFAMLPFSACSNSNEQAAYMSAPKAEENAREAEQAEQEFAALTLKQDEAVAHHTTDSKKTKKTTKMAAKSETKPSATAEKTRQPASAHEVSKEAHHAAQHGEAGQKSWTVQLGAFKEKGNAEKLTAKLKGEGFPVMMVGKEGSKSGELYLVHLEPTPNKSEAEKWQTDLKLKAFDSTLTSHRE